MATTTTTQQLSGHKQRRADGDNDDNDVNDNNDSSKKLRPATPQLKQVYRAPILTCGSDFDGVTDFVFRDTDVGEEELSEVLPLNMMRKDLLRHSTVGAIKAAPVAEVEVRRRADPSPFSSWEVAISIPAEVYDALKPAERRTLHDEVRGQISDGCLEDQSNTPSIDMLEPHLSIMALIRCDDESIATECEGMRVFEDIDDYADNKPEEEEDEDEEED